MNATLINQRFNQALKSKLNFAAIRFPNSDDVWFFYAAQSPRMRRLNYHKPEKPIFVCSPYMAGNMAYHFECDAVYKNDTCVFGDLSEVPVIDDALMGWPQGLQNNQLAQSDYTAYVNKIIAAIKQDKFDKAVAARSVFIPQVTSPENWFGNAVQQYPSAEVFMFSIQGLGTWIGATPELLLEVNKNTLQTVALAGTQTYSNEHAWTEKELEEQGMITFFIEQVLNELQFPITQITEAETIQAGNLIHLKSSVTAKLSAELLEKKFHKLLDKLNPTPAVCGLPQFEASLFIGENEGLERRFYAGFNGVIWPEGNISLFVNLRCAELVNQGLQAYVGAGITALSNAEQEWNETEGKLDTIKAVLAV